MDWSTLILFGLAVIAGMAAGVLQPIALASIAAPFCFAWAAKTQARAAPRTVLTLVLSLALALHAVPGYNNPLLLKDVQLSPQSAPYTLYANFDKGTIGLVLLAFFCGRVKSLRDFASAWRSQAPVWAALLAGVLGLAWARPDFKLPAILPLSTCCSSASRKKPSSAA